MSRLVRLDWHEMPGAPPGARITMTAPRANALEPGLLAALHAALDEAEGVEGSTILICGGPAFSSGGDVLRFQEAVNAGNGPIYAQGVVGSLQALVLRLIRTPHLVGVAMRGAATGGAAGLLFAADLAFAAPDAFVQPFYTQVGFAPDGGWTALLPERIGAGQALDWLLSNRRIAAADLVRLGLVRGVSLDPERAALAALGDPANASALASKRLIWDRARLDLVETRLSAEAEAFVAQLDTPEAKDGMARFLEKRTRAHV